MAAQEQEDQDQEQQPRPTPVSSSPELTPPESCEKLLSSYLGLSFTIFLGLLPNQSISLVSELQTHNKNLTLKLFKAEEQLKELHSRRKEDSKANARVVEIFASHRHAWQQEEKRLLEQIHSGTEEIARLRARMEELETSESELKANIEELRREVRERDEMLNFVATKSSSDFNDSFDDGLRCRISGYDDVGSRFGKVRVSDRVDPVMEECLLGKGVHNVEEMGGVYGQSNRNSPELMDSASRFLAERSSLWQDVQYEPLESVYDLKHFLARRNQCFLFRRESPWKVDCESTGVPTKMKLLEQELLNLENVGKNDLSKVSSLMRKLAKRYQALSGKIDDLCRRMQANDPCEPTLTLEFRTQRQTEFLLEAFRLQQRASETGQKLMGLQTETLKSYYEDELEGQAKVATKRSLDSIRNNLKEIQRNLEIWLARIIGDLEGILARDGASCVREYYISRYPYVQ